MKVGVLGSGSVGKVLGAGFANRGNDVMMGTREPQREDIQKWVKDTGGRVRAGTFAEAAGFGQIAVLATAWSGTENAIRLAGPDKLAGKVVIDTTNPLDFSTPGAPPALAVAGRDSGGERVQRWIPGGRVVKAFNTIGNAHMIDPQFPGGPPDMFIAGNDEDAKREVAKVLVAFGWPEPIDLGGIEMARYLEALAMIWIVHFVRRGSGSHAFKLIQK